ncbi:3-deoxy-7-phosphoheptulonate synthase [Artemisia annua]|uniref:Phospho-2-dehydro-3-deoxyheptonate aldolase n=1 Tax=Artemisia annua TaxID=35608 RepID=A0A2U1N9V6_ARTAN|nr:3-deoxy-7-phosphoheptulonate synthase [Artemisia annua]
MIIPRDIASGPAVLDFGSGMIRKDVASISTRPRSTIVVDAYSDSGYDQHTGFASNSHIEQRIVGQQPVITKGTVVNLTNECTTTKSVYFYTLHIIEDIHHRFFDPRAREFCGPICLQTSLEGEPNSGANGNRHNFYSTFHKTPNRKKFSEEEWEEFTTVKLPSYRGDNINGDSFDKKSRIPDPNRMIQAYTQPVSTLSILRAFATGCYAAMQREPMGFMDAVGLIIDHPIMTTTQIWASHECLLLPYEQPLTREDFTSGLYYDCSAHMVWVGEWTRHLKFTLRSWTNNVKICIRDLTIACLRGLLLKKTWTKAAFGTVDRVESLS